MSPEDTDLWFKMNDDKTNKEWYIHPNKAKKLLEISAFKEGMDKRIDYTQTRQEELIKVVTEMLLPFFTKGAILDFVKDNKNLDTRQFHAFLNKDKENQVLTRAFWYVKDKLEEEGKIESIKQGRGKPRLWRLKPNEV